MLTHKRSPPSNPATDDMIIQVENLKELTDTLLKLSDSNKDVVYKVSIQLLTYMPTMNKII